MYEEHFGLNSKPFGTTAEGPAIFVGPRQAQAMKSLNKALQPVDSIVVVSGPAGVGKTTVVNRALASINPVRIAIRINRMSIGPSEILELLLAGFRIDGKQWSTIQRFAAFRRVIAKYAKKGTRVAVIVEDAQRLGPAAVSELEALTAADAGDAVGANIVLMGEPGIQDWLQDPALARLVQRIRLRMKVDPLNEPEVQGYLRNAIRVAGGNYDELFAAGAARMLFHASAGVPRVVNNLVEMGLAQSAENTSGPLTSEFVRQLARDSLGVEIPGQVVTDIAATTSMPAMSLDDPLGAFAQTAVVDEPPVLAAEGTMTQKRPEFADEPVHEAELVDEGAPEVVAAADDFDDEVVPDVLTPDIEPTVSIKTINTEALILPESFPVDEESAALRAGNSQPAAAAPPTQEPPAVAEAPQAEPVAEVPDAEPVAEEPRAEPVAEVSDAEPVTEVPEAEPVAEVPEVEPVAEVPAAEPVAEVPEAEPVAEVPEAEPVAEVPAAEPVAEVPEAEPVAEVPEAEPVAEVPEAEPVAEVPEAEPVAEVPEVEPVAEVPAADPVAELPEAEPIRAEPDAEPELVFEDPLPAPSAAPSSERDLDSPATPAPAPELSLADEDDQPATADPAAPESAEQPPEFELTLAEDEIAEPAAAAMAEPPASIADTDTFARLPPIDHAPGTDAPEVAADGELSPLENAAVQDDNSAADDIPVLTLDDSLDEVRQSAPEPESPPEAATPAIDPRVVVELSRAKSLDDLDDEMAATLFGDEDFDAIAAAAISLGPQLEEAANEPSADSTEPVEATAAAGGGAPAPAVATPEPAAPPAEELALAPEASMPPPTPQPAQPPPQPKPKAQSATAGNAGNAGADGVAVPTPTAKDQQMGYTGEFQMSLTSRFRMLDELTKDKKKPVYSAIVQDGGAQPGPDSGQANGPQSIEDQLKSTDGGGQQVPRVRTPDAEREKKAKEAKPKKKGGFLSRFKR